MAETDKQSNDKQDEERRKLRNFGLLVGAIFLLWGAYRIYRARAYGEPMAAVGGVLLGAGLIVPQMLAVPYKAWMALGHILGAINTQLLLFLSYWLLIVPIGFLRRLFAGSALRGEKHMLDGEQSYFSSPTPDARGNKHFENMF